MQDIHVHSRLRHHHCGQDHGNANDLNRWKVRGQDHWQVDQGTSNQQWHSKPPAVQSEPEDQEAHGCHKMVLPLSAPFWHLPSGSANPDVFTRFFETGNLKDLGGDQVKRHWQLSLCFRLMKRSTAEHPYWLHRNTGPRSPTRRPLRGSNRWPTSDHDLQSHKERQDTSEYYVGHWDVCSTSSGPRM